MQLAALMLGIHWTGLMIWGPRLQNRLEAIIADKLTELTARVADQEEKLTACTLQLTDLEKEVKSWRRTWRIWSSSLMIWRIIPDVTIYSSTGSLSKILTYHNSHQRGYWRHRQALLWGLQHRTLSLYAFYHQPRKAGGQADDPCTFHHVLRQECIKKFKHTYF